MSQQVISVLVSAGGTVLATSVLFTVRGVFKIVKAIRDNTAAVEKVTQNLALYIRTSDAADAARDAEKAVMRKDVDDLQDWRLHVEQVNQTAALGQNGPPK